MPENKLVSSTAFGIGVAMVFYRERALALFLLHPAVSRASPFTYLSRTYYERDCEPIISRGHVFLFIKIKIKNDPVDTAYSKRDPIRSETALYVRHSWIRDEIEYRSDQMVSKFNYLLKSRRSAIKKLDDACKTSVF